jgi:prepilin-type processing-associated H-X9-DG protein
MQHTNREISGTSMRHEVLLDYLLQQLTEAESRHLEARLQTDRVLAAQLEQLRRKLRLLEQERQRILLPPPGLVERTLARIQGIWSPSSRSLPRAPRTLPDWRVTGGRFRPDILIAGCILILAGGLFFSALGKLRARHDWLACQNALRLSYYEHAVPPLNVQPSNTQLSSTLSQEVFPTSSESSLPHARWPVSEAASSFRPVFLCSLAVSPENTSSPPQTATFDNLSLWAVHFSSRTFQEHPLFPLSQPNGSGLSPSTAAPTASYRALSSLTGSASQHPPHPYGRHILYADGHVQCLNPPRWPACGTIPPLVHFAHPSSDGVE